VGQICWATVVTNKGKEHIVVGAASGSSGGCHKGLVEQIWATVVTKARITVGAASCTAQIHKNIRPVLYAQNNTPGSFRRIHPNGVYFSLWVFIGCLFTSATRGP
jgi:hypothetical protein